MEKLFIVTEFETRELKKDEFEEGMYYVVIDGKKFYSSQIDKLSLMGNEVVVITEKESMIDFYRGEIRDFYDNYHRRN